MPSMGYCVFRNTLLDLQSCRDKLFDEVSPEEHRARRALVGLCARILSDLDLDICDLDDAKLAADELPHE